MNSLDAFDSVLLDFNIRPIFDKIINNFLQKGLDFPAICAQRAALKYGFPVVILEVNFSRSDIEFAVKPGQDRLDLTALLFQ